MAKFKKALALVLSLAMVLTLAPIASVNSQAAAKYKISAKTTAISAGKTYNVKVTGVKKGQYVKVARTAGVTVKYNKKTIKASKKVAGTGKALTFKVTVPDKVANYKSTIKAVIYNKKTNKKVKTLSTKRTVKVSEFSIASVVSTTEEAGAGYKYIRATFTKALDSLDASEVEISDKITGQIYSVEKVALATSGKSADFTLVGDVAAAGTTFLQANTDYVLKVTKSGATAQLDFSIPAVRGETVVTEVDATNKQITVSGGTGFGATFTDKNGLISDFNEILGRTVTFKYDKNRYISNLKVKEETVLYGAFVGTYGAATAAGSAPVGIKDVVTEKEYKLVGATTGSIYASREVSLDGTLVGATLTSAKALATAPNAVDYAKVVLNADDTVRSIVKVTNFNGNMYVEKIDGDYIIDIANNHRSLKDYNILKGGKTIKISEITKGDTVFYDSTNKVAEVFNESVVEGKMTVNTDKITVEGKDYKTQATTNLNAEKAVTRLAKTAADYTTTLAPYTGKNVKLVLERTGALAEIIVTDEAVATTSALAVLTTDATVYTSGASYLIKFTAADGKDSTEYTIDPSKLTSLVIPGAEVKVGADGSATTNKVTGFAINKYDPSKFGGVIQYNEAVKANGAAVVYAAGTHDVINIGGVTANGGSAAIPGLAKGELVKITKNDKGEVVGLAVKANDDTTKTADTAYWVTGPAGYRVGGLASGGTVNTFEKGGNALLLNTATTGKALSKDTPVFIYNSADKTVKQIKYSEVDFSIATAAAGDIIFRSSATTVVAIVIDAVACNLNNSSIDSTVKGVVVDSTTALDGKMSKLVIYSGDEKITYTEFANDVASASLVLDPGAIVKVNLTKDKKVYSVDQGDFVSYGYTGSDYGTSLVTTGIYKNADSNVTTTIVTVEADGTVKPITWYEYFDSNVVGTTTPDTYYSLSGTQASFADVIVVCKGGANGPTGGIATDLAAACAETSGFAVSTANTFTATQTNGSTISWTLLVTGNTVSAVAASTVTVGAASTTTTSVLRVDATLGGVTKSAWYRVTGDGSALTWTKYTSLADCTNASITAALNATKTEIFAIQSTTPTSISAGVEGVTVAAEVKTAGAVLNAGAAAGSAVTTITLADNASTASLEVTFTKAGGTTQTATWSVTGSGSGTYTWN